MGLTSPQTSSCHSHFINKSTSENLKKKRMRQRVQGRAVRPHLLFASHFFRKICHLNARNPSLISRCWSVLDFFLIVRNYQAPILYFYISWNKAA